jgi:hypothetical protein
LFEQYMLHFWVFNSIITATAILAAIFVIPINKEMVEVEKHSSGHNVSH